MTLPTVIGMTLLDIPDGDVLGYLDPTDAAQADPEAAILHGGTLVTCVEASGHRAVDGVSQRSGFEGTDWWPVASPLELLRAAEARSYALRGTANATAGGIRSRESR